MSVGQLNWIHSYLSNDASVLGFKLIYIYTYFYEHSEQARGPHTNGPRDVPRRGALSLLQKAYHYRGFI